MYIEGEQGMQEVKLTRKRQNKLPQLKIIKDKQTNSKDKQQNKQTNKQTDKRKRK